MTDHPNDFRVEPEISSLQRTENLIDTAYIAIVAGLVVSFGGVAIALTGNPSLGWTTFEIAIAVTLAIAVVIRVAMKRALADLDRTAAANANSAKPTKDAP